MTKTTNPHNLQPGEVLTFKNQQGYTWSETVIRVTETSVFLRFTHLPHSHGHRKSMNTINKAMSTMLQHRMPTQDPAGTPEWTRCTWLYEDDRQLLLAFYEAYTAGRKEGAWNLVQCMDTAVRDHIPMEIYYPLAAEMKADLVFWPAEFAHLQPTTTK